MHSSNCFAEPLATLLWWSYDFLQTFLFWNNDTAIMSPTVVNLPPYQRRWHEFKYFELKSLDSLTPFLFITKRKKNKQLNIGKHKTNIKGMNEVFHWNYILSHLLLILKMLVSFWLSYNFPISVINLSNLILHPFWIRNICSVFSYLYYYSKHWVCLLGSMINIQWQKLADLSKT